MEPAREMPRAGSPVFYGPPASLPPASGVGPGVQAPAVFMIISLDKGFYMV